MSENFAGEIVGQILRDLCDRKGLSHEWSGIDRDIQLEIVNKWIAIATAVIANAKPKPRPWLRAEEVREEGWYWFRGYCRFITKVAVDENGMLFANDPDLFFEPISQIGDATARWQRIPEPELPEEGES